MKKPVSPAMAHWGWPVVMAVLTAMGLFCGLWGDGPWDLLSWLGLGVPTVAALYFGLRGRTARR